MPRPETQASSRPRLPRAARRTQIIETAAGAFLRDAMKANLSDRNFRVFGPDETTSNRLTHLFLEVCEANRRYRDFTRHDLHAALREVAVHLGVYRTYVRVQAQPSVSAQDRAAIDAAVAGAGFAWYEGRRREPFGRPLAVAAEVVLAFHASFGGVVLAGLCPDQPVPFKRVQQGVDDTAQARVRTGDTPWHPGTVTFSPLGVVRGHGGHQPQQPDVRDVQIVQHADEELFLVNQRAVVCCASCDRAAKCPPLVS